MSYLINDCLHNDHHEKLKSCEALFFVVVFYFGQESESQGQAVCVFLLCNSAEQSSFILTDGKMKPLDVIAYNTLLFLMSHNEELKKEINRTVANNKTNTILHI
jgi:hypothetical protein